LEEGNLILAEACYNLAVVYNEVAESDRH